MIASLSIIQLFSKGEANNIGATLDKWISIMSQRDYLC